MTTPPIRRCLFVLLFSALVGAALAPSYAAGDRYDAGMRAYDAGDYAKALEIWGPLAEGGDAVAQYSLGKLLENGGGPVEIDSVEAAKWYRQASDQGIPAAQNNLGLMYAKGNGVPLDLARAAELWLSAAEKDHVIAQFNLGLAYFRGEGVAEDRIVAVSWLRRAGDLGLAPAQYAMGQVIRMGLAADVDEAEALRWYEMAAAQGDKKAEVQAEELRKAGVTPKAPAAEIATAVAKAPAPPPVPVVKPRQVAAKPSASVQPAPTATAAVKAKPAPEPQPAQTQVAVAAPAPEPAAQPAQTQVAVATPAPEPAAQGRYRIWLISLKNKAEASRYLEAARAKHPAIFAEARGAVAPANLGKGGIFHRVVAGGLPSQQAARDLCRRLRAADPAAFCKVLAN